MKKIAKLTSWVLLIILAFTFALSSCGKKETPQQTVEPSESSTPAGNETVGADFGEYSATHPLELKSASYGKGEKNYHNRASNHFSEALVEAFGGAVDVKVYNDGLLAENDRELLDGLKMGSWDIGYNNTGVMSNYNEKYAILDLPYLFRDYDHVNAFLQSDLAEELCTLLTDQNVVTLAIAFYGFRNTALTDAPVVVPEDLNGVLIRVMESDYYVKAFRAFGAEPQSMAASEIITALQQGTIEAVENSNNIFLNSGHYEFCPYLSKTEHVGGFYGINIAKATWDKMTPDMQALAKQVALEVAMEESLLNEETADKNEASLIEKGMTVNEVEKDKFIEKCAGIYEEFNGKYGSDWYDAIVAMAK